MSPEPIIEAFNCAIIYIHVEQTSFGSVIPADHHFPCCYAHTLPHKCTVLSVYGTLILRNNQAINIFSTLITIIIIIIIIITVLILSLLF